MRVLTATLEDAADELHELSYEPRGAAWTDKSCPACRQVRRILMQQPRGPAQRVSRGTPS